jgi:hypothetical protein
MIPASPTQGIHVPSTPIGCRAFLTALGVGMSLALHAQSGVPTYTTNRFDIDVDGQVDFEFITQTSTESFPGPGGINTYTSTQVTLVPRGSSRILTLRESTPLATIPTFADGASIGPAGSDQVWSSNPAIVLSAVEPFGLSGALAPVWVFAPGTLHVGISIGAPASPHYAWMSFDRERRLRYPMAWGYSRTPGAPVTAGDPSTIPPMTLRVTHTTSPEMLRLQWQPDFANMTVEESTDGGPWTAIGTTTFSQLIFSRAQDASIPHLFRARRIP